MTRAMFLVKTDASSRNEGRGPPLNPMNIRGGGK